MAFLPNRRVPIAAGADALYDAWLADIDRALDDPKTDRWELCRRVLTEIYYPELAGVDPDTLPLGTRVALAQMDARNVTREPEYYAETDDERYARVKPLLWMWEMFDASPLGENVHLGVKFRRILARRIFRRCGRNFKAFHQVKFSFGYNMEVGDNVVVHREVLLDDRGGIRLGNGVSISDFANVYSHSHDIVEGREIETPVTVIGDGVRVTYHATVMSGVTLAEGTMLGSFAVATRDTEPHSIYVGIPARKVRDKPLRERPPATPDPLADE
ncbi:MAG: acyltransferase [Alphaproteobacteria bacterium]|nr:MAG: acyltransferase [Alphaproteobacteria bacterium]